MGGRLYCTPWIRARTATFRPPVTAVTFLTPGAADAGTGVNFSSLNAITYAHYIEWLHGGCAAGACRCGAGAGLEAGAQRRAGDPDEPRRIEPHRGEDTPQAVGRPQAAAGGELGRQSQ